MAFACNRFMNRASVSSLRSAIRYSLPKSPIGTGSSPTASSAGFRIPSKPAASPVPRFSFSRCPSELGCVQSLLPLNSTVAAARLTSCLSTTSRSSRALSQGPEGRSDSDQKKKEMSEGSCKEEDGESH